MNKTVRAHIRLDGWQAKVEVQQAEVVNLHDLSTVHDMRSWQLAELGPQEQEQKQWPGPLQRVCVEQLATCSKWNDEGL